MSTSQSPSLTIRPYTDSDFQTMIDAFNARIAWLTSKGLAAQWGSEPLGSTKEQSMREAIVEETAKGVKRWVAEVDGHTAGWLVIAPYRTKYIPDGEDKPGKECFLKTLLVNPDFAGLGVGDMLLEFAKKHAKEEDAVWLRLDCWRGPEGQDGLVRYYESKGFKKARTFVVPGKDEEEPEWPGQFFEMKL